ncbi:hypothetical protein KY328_00455 [Candidatus Woesearchaeota archaeon]|nr:hypothetical protein [Candidatus Woesearchaeota archaeon]MBW3021367.1 hypothetical protein [Candidatus Woesearchaeota archaeon]
MNKQGFEFAWYHIIGFILLIALLLWIMFFSKGAADTASEFFSTWFRF